MAWNWKEEYWKLWGAYAKLWVRHERDRERAEAAEAALGNLSSMVSQLNDAVTQARRENAGLHRQVSELQVELTTADDGDPDNTYDAAVAQVYAAYCEATGFDPSTDPGTDPGATTQ